MKKTAEKKNRTEHFYNARKRLIVAGAVTLAVPLTGVGSLIAIKGIKELVKEYKVQAELAKVQAESDEICEDLLTKAKAEAEQVSEEQTEEQTTNEGS